MMIPNSSYLTDFNIQKYRRARCVLVISNSSGNHKMINQTTKLK